MGTFKILVLIILFISFMVFVTFFGRLPALRNTPIATLHRLIWVHFPNAVIAADERLSSGKITRSLSRLGRFLMHDRHPTIVIFFLAIMIVSEYMFLPQVWHDIGWFTKSTAAMTVAAPYILLYLACAADPGYITSQNVRYHMQLYPYDYTLFHPGRECRTCRLPKPARSKHCSICKRCVAKADHHCIFINSCVGYGNQHYFLLLLVATAVLATYGGCLGLSILASRLQTRYPVWSLWPPKEMEYGRWLSILGWGIQRNVNLGATTLLAALISPLVWGLCIYSFYLVYGGVTTNESLKWSELHEDMKDGYAFRRYLPINHRRDGAMDSGAGRWPVDPEHIILYTNDGKPPRDHPSMPGEGEWEHIRRLKDAENLYDLGFWNNLLDVFVPDYQFGALLKTDVPSVERRRLKKRRPSNV
ncbi:DHHC palmitoyltransferase-domain-containing protein [Stachybotrys elegans]|uniref:Palmitoyltransferase n=1 Tax=Stachybotrys elegans TaxID=80388 RepID=A0A8K0SHF2_9HYPO|nr:DHHC palmitoyltransferase-domain-containing protein [Stachybotrys elegans]